MLIKFKRKMDYANKKECEVECSVMYRPVQDRMVGP